MNIVKPIASITLIVLAIVIVCTVLLVVLGLVASGDARHFMAQFSVVALLLALAATIVFSLVDQNKR